MAYGVLAKAAGMWDIIMESGAGAYNFIEAIGGVGTLKDIFSFDSLEAVKKILHGLSYEIFWVNSYFDDPRDNVAIKLGVEYYYKL